MTATLARVLAASCFLVLFILPGASHAQPSKGTPAARAEFDRGKAAVADKQWDSAMAAFRKAIDLDPTFFDAHEQYVYATRRKIDKWDEANATLRTVYTQWLNTQPRNAILHYFLGAFEASVSEREKHLIRAVELDSRFPQAYRGLATCAEVRGDKAQARAFLRKAADSAPEDASFAVSYASSFELDDPVRWKDLSLGIVQRFPGNENAAMALYWLAVGVPPGRERVQYLERLKREFPPRRFAWSVRGMRDLFVAYAASDPDKALALAEEMAKLKPDDDQWKAILSMGHALTKARDLVATGKGPDALAVLDAVKPPQELDVTSLHLAKAAAERAMGEPEKAYARLADLVAARPLPGLHAALLEHGRRSHLTDAQVKADVQARREQRAKTAEEFELENYLDGSKVTLAKYRGKVVLLNFWYPG